MADNKVQMVIDGMTGVGKTTLVEILARELDLEPFNEIFEDENQLLHKFFHDRTKWAFPMQISFLNHRFRQYKQACRLNSAIMDRSIFSDNIFALMYKELSYFTPEEYNVYFDLLQNMLEHIRPPMLIVYLRVSAKEAIRRIKKRGRPDELDVEDNYWRKLCSFYDDIYRHYSGDLLVIDVDALDFVRFKDHRIRIVGEIKERWESLLSSGGDFSRYTSP
ncbi:MAG: deoxynucleoside kinase [Peptococcaceae bacterium]|jgi:deoxyadenosine/deoxycytidine kinase|nr:deoxynucleoside kinase [Peptococcaceae bacterium]